MKKNVLHRTKIGQNLGDIRFWGWLSWTDTTVLIRNGTTSCTATRGSISRGEGGGGGGCHYRAGCRGSTATGQDCTKVARQYGLGCARVAYHGRQDAGRDGGHGRIDVGGAVLLLLLADQAQSRSDGGGRDGGLEGLSHGCGTRAPGCLDDGELRGGEGERGGPAGGGSGG